MKGVISPLLSISRGDGEMADAAALGAALCGFKSRSPYHYKSSDSSTDRMLGYEPGDVGSIPPPTFRPSSPQPSNFQALSSAVRTAGS